MNDESDSLSNFSGKKIILLSICSISVKFIQLRVKVKLPVRHQRAFLVNISYTISRIGTKIGVRVDIDKGYHLVKGRGHWVKGQGQIHDLLKKMFWL